MQNPIKVKRRKIGNLSLLILKISAASGIAWELAKLAGSKHPFLAPLSVILCVQTTIMQSIRYSFHRLLGTVVGVVLTIWAADYVPLNGWTLALLLVLVSGVALLIERKEGIVHEVALSVLLVFALQKQSGHYGIDRIRDTFIGVAVGLAIHMIVFPPNLMKQAESKVFSLMNRLQAWFIEAAAWIQNGFYEDQSKIFHSAAQTFHKELLQVEKQLEKAAESIKFNMTAKSGGSLLQDNQYRVSLMKYGAAYLERTTNFLSEWYSTGTLSDDERNKWAAMLNSFGANWKDLSNKTAGLSVPVLESASMQIELDEHLRYSAAIYTETSTFLKQFH